MKDVYSDTLHIEADCGRGFKSVLIYSGSDKLYYGEKPKSSMETYDNQETVFDDLKTIAGWHCEVRKTVLRKREYLYFPWVWTCKDRIYKDKLRAIRVYYVYNRYVNTPIAILSQKLSAESFTEYIFDREQELKSIYATMQE